MTGKKLPILLLLLCTTFSCSRKFGIQRQTVFRDRTPGVSKNENCAMIRGAVFEASLEPISAEQWEKIFAYELYSGERKTTPRLPAFPFYHLVIANTGNTPLALEDLSITLRHGSTEIKTLTPGDAGKLFTSPAFSIFNFTGILTSKRLLAEKFCIKEIDYALELLDYRLGFLNPGERLLLIISFGWIPVEVRQYTIRIGLKNSDPKKSIDFELSRFEYRTKGNVFKKSAGPEQENLR